ncbi:Uma2 family endonuclease [bacterium]|nr:Uma2 family endonuclease [bacterium]
MATTIQWEATVEDLARVEGKAELVDGAIRKMSPSGYEHGVLAGLIYRSLWAWCEQYEAGHVLTDSVGFLCDLPGRKSFSPDVAYYDGPLPGNRKRFLPEPPVFAVEIRSENDYGPAAEIAMSTKRADYFAAGTKAVWDVDAEGPEIVRLYLASNPASPIAFRRGEIAHAEPVLPGWRLPVDEIMKELERP